ncbi:MAG: hypothetical protein JJE10_08340 [Thermoleophilia bacterium]|nr:hypothetical protein [Thermoleophilia bacterium]
MTMTSRYLKLSVISVLGAAALFLLLLGGAPKAQAAEVKCPTFRVLHNDQIGKLKLPTGTYGMTVLNGDKLTCPKASKLFAEFLQDWDGKLRKPWVVNVKQSSFTAGRGSDRGFRVKKGGSSGGGGGGGHTSRSCPGYFTVVHNDRIGSFKVPKGKYRITLVGPRKINCPTAVKRFQEFLLDYDGVLPAPWYLHRNTATFTRGKTARVGFNINRAYGPAPKPKKNTKHARCPGTFRVLNNDRIGKLKLPQGPYYITVSNKPAISCASASKRFTRFLNDYTGNLPRAWRLNPGKARFTSNVTGAWFRVKQAG